MPRTVSKALLPSDIVQKMMKYLFEYIKKVLEGNFTQNRTYSTHSRYRGYVISSKRRLGAIYGQYRQPFQIDIFLTDE